MNCKYKFFRDEYKLYVEFSLLGKIVVGQITYLDFLTILETVYNKWATFCKKSFFGNSIKIYRYGLLSDEKIMQITFPSKCQRDEVFAYLDSFALLKNFVSLCAFSP